VRIRIVIALATAMLLLGPAVGLRPRPCRSGVILVPIDYRTVQDAIDAASPGSTILVLPGRYEESLRIVKPLRLVGLHATIDAGGQRYAVYVESGGVTFQGFVVTGASWAGMFVTPYVDLSKIVIAASKFVSNDGWGLYAIEHREGVGWESGLLIRGNVFSSNSYDGIALETVGYALIQSNKICGNGPGYVGISIFDGSHDIAIEHNVILDNDWGGIWIDYRENPDIVIKENVIANHQGSPGTGIEIEEGASYQTYAISRNLIVRNNYGIVLWNGPQDNPFPENCLIFNSEDYSTCYQ